MELEKKLCELKPIMLNCNKFSIYDYPESYTITELLCEFFTKINECIEICNKTIDLVTWLTNEGLKIEVAKKLDEWLKDGTLAELINEKLLKEINDKVSDLDTKIDAANLDLKPYKEGICILNSNMTIEDINNKLLDNYGTYIFRNGNYLVSPDSYIKVHSNNKNIYFEPDAYIKQTVPDSGKYVMLEIRNSESVNIYNPNIWGRMDTGSSATEWGYGIEITASKDIKVYYPKILSTTGDGIYIGYKWNEEFTNIKKTENIHIINPYIDGVSRNGITLASGNNIIIDNPICKNIRRKFPQSGIDIEPENGDRSIVHLDNITINNLYTENCDVGIITAHGLELLNTNVTVTNHHSRKCTANLFMAEWQPSGTFNYNNCKAIDTNRHGIIIGKKNNRSRLFVNDFVVEKRNESKYPSDEYASSCIVFDGIGGNNLGNISFNNIYILDIDNYMYSLFTKDGSSRYTNVSLNGLFGTPQAPTLRIYFITGLKMGNVNTSYDSTFGEINFNIGNVPTDSVISSELSAPTKRVFEPNLPDGIYETGTNRVNSQTFTVEFKTGLTVLGRDKNTFTSNKDGAYMQFKKHGNDIIILNMQNME